jgi:hypothetical protein
MEPRALRDPLNGVLGDAINRRDLNLVVHLGRVENWLIQGVPTGSVDGIPTFGQTEAFGAYCGESPIRCSEGTCTTTFRPNTEDHELFIQVKMPLEGDPETCAFQQLQLVDVHIEVNAQVFMTGGDGSPMVTSSVTVRGILPYDVADDFMLTDTTNLLDMFETTDDTDAHEEGWPMVIAGAAREVYFDNDPGAAIVSSPTQAHLGTMAENTRCNP